MCSDIYWYVGIDIAILIYMKAPTKDALRELIDQQQQELVALRNSKGSDPAKMRKATELANALYNIGQPGFAYPVTKEAKAIFRQIAQEWYLLEGKSK